MKDLDQKEVNLVSCKAHTIIFCALLPPLGPAAPDPATTVCLCIPVIAVTVICLLMGKFLIIVA